MSPPQPEPPARVREIRVAAEHANRAVAVAPPYVFHVRVENAAAEFADEFHIVHALITEMRRVVIETKARMILDRFERALGGNNVEGDFRGMHFERKVDVFLFKHIEDGQEAFGEVGITFVPEILIGRREAVN